MTEPNDATPLGAADSLRQHWPEYTIEAAAVALLMLAVGVASILTAWPGSPLFPFLGTSLARSGLLGAVVGATVITIVYSPFGKQSGAHFNPAVTLAFLRLGKVRPWDALFYIVAQCVGGFVAVGGVAALAGASFTEPPVAWAASHPGATPIGLAFAGELLLAGVLMSIVLWATNTTRLHRFTGVLCAGLLASYVAVAAPLSSLNPARSLVSTVPAGLWQALWLYLLAPPLGMAIAAEIFVRVRGRGSVMCAKLHLHNHRRCIFHACGYRTLEERGESPW